MVGYKELILILLIVLVVFGGSRLPALAEGLAKSIKAFKRGMSSDDDIEISKKELSDKEP